MALGKNLWTVKVGALTNAALLDWASAARPNPRRRRGADAGRRGGHARRARHPGAVAQSLMGEHK